MTNQEVAKFHNISLGGFKHWSAEQRRRARIEAEVAADKEMQLLLAELQRLAFVYNCANVQGINQHFSCTVMTPTAGACSVSFYQQDMFDPFRKIFIDLYALDAVEQLKVAKLQLEQVTYGAKTDV